MAKLPYSENIDEKQESSSIILESVITIFEENQVIWKPETVAQKLKVFIGIAISKVFYFGIIVGFVFGLDQIRSDGFRCRKLKIGTEFLLTNETNAADYLGMSFQQIFKFKKKNGEGIYWFDDQVNGLLSEYEYSEFGTEKSKFEQKFNHTSDLIDEFNSHGFHDVCNVLTWSNVTYHHVLPPWFETKNATGRLNLMFVDFLIY